MTNNPREIKGLEIAARCKLTNRDGLWLVPSQSKSKKYKVNLENQHCSCPDHEYSQAVCKHLYAVQFVIQRETATTTTTDTEGNTTTITATTEKVTRKTYTQDWPAYHTAQVNEKSQFLALLYELCQGVEEPIQTFGRPRASFADIIFAASYRVYSTLSGRRFMTDLRDAKARGYLSRLPSYNSMFDYLQMPSLTPYLKRLIELSALPLKSVEVDFAVDSSGFSTCRFTRWFDVRYGKNEDWREWLKLHMICGVKTNIITSVEVTEAYANDSPYFKPLVEQTVRNGFRLAEVSADKAYLSAVNLETVDSHGGKAYIPFKSNSLPDRNGELWERLYSYYNNNRVDFLAHYHKRSNSETVFSMLKAKFGERLRCKTQTAQINEALCKVLAHNLCCVIQSMYELGIDACFTEKPEAVAC